VAAENILVAAGAVVLDERGRVLLVKHREEKGGFWQGKWICPGGKLERGERIEDGIRREVLEETGLDIELVRPLVPFERIVRSEGQVELHVIYIDYIAKKDRGELVPGSDVGEARWVPRESLPEIWDELHEDTRRLFQIANLA
jgi:ADP-ribose pyrophosphatase YjhB (NUDIX family)